MICERICRRAGGDQVAGESVYALDPVAEKHKASWCIVLDLTQDGMENAKGVIEAEMVGQKKRSRCVFTARILAGGYCRNAEEGGLALAYLPFPVPQARRPADSLDVSLAGRSHLAFQRSVN